MAKRSEFEKRCDRAAQDILNLLACTCIELRGWTLPVGFDRKFSKSKLSALIQTRMMEGSYIRGEQLKEV